MVCSGKLIIIENVNFPAKLFYLISKIELCSSSSEARRQILGGGVRINGEKITDPNLAFENPDSLLGKIIQVGKKKLEFIIRKYFVFG